jgi:hypothetical protein
MTGGGHPSAVGADACARGMRAGRARPEERLGRRAGGGLRWAGRTAGPRSRGGLRQRLGQKGTEKEWFKRKGFLFFKCIQTIIQIRV